MTLPAGCAQVACSRQGFDGGRIYFKAGIGAFEIHGPVYAFFLSLKGAAGPLGFPTSNVKTRSDGSTASRFEHGKVTCPATGPCVQS